MLLPCSVMRLARGAAFFLLVFLVATFGACGGDTQGAALAQGCVINTDCATPLVCGFGRCHAACTSSRDCPNGEHCVLGGTAGVCALDDESTCSGAKACPGDLTCAVDGRCRNVCQANVDCLPGQTCAATACADTTELNDAGQLTAADGAAPSDAGATDDGDAKDASVDGDGAAADRATGPENCSNGIDDDGDDKIDCADEDCGMFQCVPLAPLGWVGPVAFTDAIDAMTDGSVASCPSLFPNQLIEGGENIGCPSATCAPCKCTQSTAATCQADTHSLWTISDCTGTGLNEDVVASGDCVNGDFSATYLKLSQPHTVGGACTPSGGQATKTTAAFGTRGLVCGGAAPLQGGCAPTDRCIAQALAPFTAGACVYQTGELACPAADYTVKHVLYQGISDSRSCTTCACDKATKADCTTFTTKFFAAASCMGTSNGSAVQPTCAAIPYQGSALFQATAPTIACPHSGGEPSGGCTGTQPTTVCCTK